MNDRRFTRAALWLGTRLAVSGNADGGEWVSALLREAAQLGFAEPIARAAFGEIGATAERYGTSSETWSLSPTRRQAWANFAVANDVPAITNTPLEAIVEFWKPKPATAAPAAAAQPKPAAYTGPPLSAAPALLKAATERALEVRADAAARTNAEATAPRIDAAKYRALRQDAIAKARGR